MKRGRIHRRTKEERKDGQIQRKHVRKHSKRSEKWCKESEEKDGGEAAAAVQLLPSWPIIPGNQTARPGN